MPSHPETVRHLIDRFAGLPGIGARTAERLTLHLLRVPQQEALALAEAIVQLRQKLRTCSVCHNLSDSDPCHICCDPGRDRSTICVVEDPRDVVAIEKSGSFNGLFHVLMGRYSPLDGLDESSLTLDSLVSRVKKGAVREVLLATNPNLEGDATAILVAQRLAGLGVALTRIASGVPQGSRIEHVPGSIIGDAIRGRRAMKPQAAQQGARPVGQAGQESPRQAPGDVQ